MPDNVLTRALRRFTSSNAELEAIARRRSAEEAGAVPVQSCRDRQLVVLSGTITCVTRNPRGGSRWLEADLDDGSGQVRLVFMGRREIPGIAAGTVLRVRGRVSCAGTGRTVYNPRYEILSVPNS